MKKKFLKKMAEPFEFLFWKAQIGILRSCPPMVGVVSGFSMGAANSPRLWMRTLRRIAVQAPRAVARHGRDRREKRVVLSRVTIVVTMRCTLNCDKCVVMVPDLTIPKDIPLDVLLDDLRALFACVDKIYTLTISGGEALIHPKLDEIIRFCAGSGKINDIILQSNGTVIPNERVLAALKEA